MQARSASVSGNVADRYTALIDLGHVLTGILRPADLYEALGARLARALPLDAFFLSRVDDSGRATVVHRSDTARAGRGDTSYRAADCLAIRDRRAVLHLPGDPAAVCRSLGIDSRNRPAVSAPVMRQGRVAGVLTILGPTNAVYDNPDLEFLAAVADLLGASPTDGGPLSDASRRELEALDHITRAIATLALDDALEHSVQAAHELLGADGTALWLVRTGGEVSVTNAQGAIAPKRGDTAVLSHELFRELATRKQPMPFDNSKEAEKGLEQFRKLTTGAAGYVVPLHAQDRVLGAMVCCFREPHSAGPEALGALSRFSALAAVAAGYARLNDQIGTLSLLDPLTGIPNRRHLAMYLEKEFAAARRGRRLTLLIFDIDDFERYNKSNGRQAGDSVLRAFGELLVQHTRAMNLAARYEGDAFIVALTDADRRAAFIHASRIARAAESHPLIGPAGVHASAGIASYTPRMKTFEDLIHGAQKDLEVRKTGGGRLTI